ncbi:MAG: hypothetical protein IKQ71_00905 [Lachnospiraceae bacterium]|nr:hypothetical protein [Lachnospiraceae bacterium]
MKYVFREIRTFFRDNTLIAIITIVLTSISVFVIHFSFAIMAQYEMARQIREGHTTFADIQDSPYEFSCKFKNSEDDYVTKADMDECLDKIIKNIDTLKECGNTIGIVTMGSEKVDWHYEIPMDFEFKIELDKEGIKAPKEFFRNLIEGGFFGSHTDGWTDEQEAKGWNAALVWDHNKMDIPPGFTMPTWDAYPTGVVIVGNNYYHIGGWQTYSVNPIVPYSSLDDDFKMDSIVITFNEYISEASFGHLYNIFTDKFGDKIVLRSDSVKKAKRTMYSTVFAVAIAIVLLSVVNLVLLLSYFVEKRKKITRSYMLAGVNKRNMSMIYLSGYILITSIVYCVSLIIFVKLVLPKLETLLPYCSTLFSPVVYITIFLSFTLLVIVFGYISNLREFKKAGWG